MSCDVCITQGNLDDFGRFDNELAPTWVQSTIHFLGTSIGQSKPRLVCCLQETCSEYFGQRKFINQVFPFTFFQWHLCLSIPPQLFGV